MSHTVFSKENLPRLLMLAVTAVLITIAGIIFRQSPLRILPLYISLFIGMLQSRANRFAPLLGGFNSILYSIVYLYLGLYASAGYALLFSCPIQLMTFARWSRNRYEESTRFRRLSRRMRACIFLGFAAAFAVLSLILRSIGSDYSILDSLSSLLGILVSVLTMFAFIEYTWLMLPSVLITMCLDISVTAMHPAQITYVIFDIYSFICVTIGFFRVRHLFAAQQRNMQLQ